MSMEFPPIKKKIAKSFLVAVKNKTTKNINICLDNN